MQENFETFGLWDSKPLHLQGYLEGFFENI